VPRRLEAPLSTVWLVVVVVGALTFAIKATGPALLGGRQLPPRLFAVLELLAPALLAALVVTQAIAGERKYVFDARLLGVAAALVAVRLRAPLLVTVVLAAVVTAVARAV
jgi:branched-subunit amino acid transport protein